MSLRVIGLKKTYDNFSLSLDFSVSKGETLALVGPSGSGKTTVLNLLAGLAAPESGKILSGNKDISFLPAWKRNISVVFQDLALFPHLDVGGNIAYGLRIRKVPPAERRKIIENMLKMVHLPGYASRRIDTLSGGERQRVAIARSLACSPRALLLDEPFSSLDAPLRKTLNMEFKEIRSHSDAPCIFVTHNKDEAVILGDRIALMEDGQIIETGTGRELILAPKTAFCAGFFGAGQVMPCAIKGKNHWGIEVSCPLGILTIKENSEYNPLCPKFFIPNDAIFPDTAQGEAGHKCFNARCTGQRFEGQEQTISFLPIRESVPQTINEEFSPSQEVELVLGPRTPPPKNGEIRSLCINQSLLKFVK